MLRAKVVFSAGLMAVSLAAGPTLGQQALAGEPARITSGQLSSRGPAWSPDGRLIAFESDRGGNWDLYLIDPLGGGPTRLTESSSSDRYPGWSPQGSRIVFVSDRSGTPDLYLLELRSRGVKHLTSRSRPGRRTGKESLSRPAPARTSLTRSTFRS